VTPALRTLSYTLERPEASCEFVTRSSQGDGRRGWFVSDIKPTDWIVAIAALATCGGVAVLFLQLRELTRQIKLQHFADYTTRHQSIVLGLPDAIAAPGFALAERPDYERTLQRMRAYFDLSFEKWYLNRKHQIDSDI
jgi:hypothetical protein